MMGRRSQEEWRGLFSEQAASGQTAVEFCGERGLNAQYFSKRRLQLLGKRYAGARTRKRSAFVAIQVPQAMRVRLASGIELELPGSVSPGWVAELLGALGG